MEVTVEDIAKACGDHITEEEYALLTALDDLEDALSFVYSCLIEHGWDMDTIEPYLISQGILTQPKADSA